MKYFGLVLLLILFSCTKKDTKICYKCRTTYFITTDSPVQGYPASTTIENELCNITEEAITVFEDTNRGSESSTVNGVLYSSSFATICSLE
jgi:hypothetical protein